MPYIKENLYSCDFCDIEIEWDKTDEVHGEMWGCEVCGSTFCSKCLKEAVGEDGYRKIMQDSDLIRCPNCAKEFLKNELKAQEWSES